MSKCSWCGREALESERVIINFLGVRLGKFACESHKSDFMKWASRTDISIKEMDRLDVGSVKE